VASRRKNDNATAKSKIRMMGLWNCASSRVRARFPHAGLCREGVALKSLCLAPSADRPLGGGLEVERQILQGHGPEGREALV
jgi:hypothetical protein